MHWNTVTLGGDVLDDVLKRMIERSYDLIVPKRKQNANFS
jgi:predicted DNA-binding protein (MmcQ/YjbR family)